MKMDFPKPVALIENIKQTDARDGHMDEIEIPILQWMEPGEIEEDPLEISKIEQVMVKEEFVEQNETLFEENDGLTTPNKISIKAVKTNGTAKNEFDERNEFLYMCCDCSFSTDTQGKLQQHTISSHLSQLIKKKMNENISYSKMKNNPKTNKLNKPTELQINSIRKEQQFACNLCNFSSSYARKLTRHIITSHKKNQWSCQFCNFISCSRFVLEEHISQSHSHASIKQGTKIVVREESNEIAEKSTEISLESGIKKKVGDELTMDHYDNIEIPNKVKVVEDAETNINDAFYQCKEEPSSIVNGNHEGIVFNAEDETNVTNEKITQESGDKIYSCKFCDYKSIRSKYYLKLHVMSKHTGEKPQQCDFCEYRCVYVSLLKKHVLNSHSEIQLKKCSFCTTRVVKNFHLKAHITRNHTSKGPFTCDFCKLKFCTVKLLKEHIKNGHRHRWFTRFCNTCNFKCFTIYDLEVHMMYNHDIKPLLCKLCDAVCYSEASLKEHVETEHNTRKKSCCNFCEYVCHDNRFKTVNASNNCNVKCINSLALNKHIIREHSSEKLKTCLYCTFEYTIEDALKEHLSVNHSDKLCKCKFCDFSTMDDLILVDHVMKTHPAEKPFTCSSCDYKCYDSLLLKEHLKKHVEDTQPSCPLCDFKCTYPYMMRNHMNFKHSGRKLHSCKLCSFKCLINTALKKHTLTNHTNTLIKCIYCGYVNDNDIMLEHTEIEHSNEKSFSCSFCDFTCNNLDLLKKHSSDHNSEEQSCKVCDFKYIYICQLQKHTESKHTDVEFNVCNFCEYKYNTLDELNDHLLSYHANKVLKCRFCNYKCYDTTMLKDHIMGKHAVKTSLTCCLCDFQTTQPLLMRTHVTRAHPVSRKRKLL